MTTKNKTDILKRGWRMMAEYIDRVKLIHHLQNCIDEVKNTNRITEDFEVCLKVIKNQPLANVEEVKCGQWVVDGFDETYNCYEAHCSNCGMNLEMNFDGDKPYIDLNTAYCRCCGAKMNGWCEDYD